MEEATNENTRKVFFPFCQGHLSESGMEISSCSFGWRIPNFQSYQIGMRQKSPSIDGLNRSWSLILSSDLDQHDKAVVKIGIQSNTFQKLNNALKIQFIVVIANKENQLVAGDSIFCDDFEDIKSLLQIEYDKLVGSASDWLLISCQINLISVKILNSDGISINAGVTSETSEVDIASNQPYNFETFMESPEFSDVTFSVGGQEIHAHKIILSKNSSVFAAMFTHDMKEQRDNVVEIKQISYEAFKEALRYMYCRKVENLSEIAYDLVNVAEKYALDELKNLCIQTLFKDLNIFNAPKTYRIAELYDLDYLKEKSFNLCVIGMRRLSNLKLELLPEGDKTAFVEVYEKIINNPLFG